MSGEFDTESDYDWQEEEKTDDVTAKTRIVKRGVGRPPTYKPEFAQVAHVMCRMGATDNELAEAFGVTTGTIWQWQVSHPEFSEAVKIQKGEYDERIMRSLAMRALGYTYDAEKIHVAKDGTVTRILTKEHVPPDAGAAKNWLAARRAKEGWSETKRLEVTGADGQPLQSLSDVELYRRFKMLEALIQQGQPQQIIDVDSQLVTVDTEQK